MGVSCCIALRKNYIRKKDGKAALYIRIIENRKVYYHQTGEWIRPTHWNGKRVTARERDHKRINSVLDLLITEAKKEVSQGLPVSSSKVATSSNRNEEKSTNEKLDFFSFFRNLINEKKSRLSKGTIRNYNGEYSKLKKYRTLLYYKDIDECFVRDYDEYMRSILCNSPNTISKTFRILKVVVKDARERGFIETDPFKKYQMPKESSKREYLNWAEVQKLEALKDAAITKNMRTAIKAFLFGCYTGLRYKDIRELNNAQIKDGMINLRMSKTKELVSIPLSQRAASLISQGEEFPIKVFNNSRMNSYLKLAALRIGIKKKVTFHVSRHTFATISLNLGIPMEVVSKLLGHTDLKTTQIYAKLMDKTKVEMMKKWDELD